MEAPAQYTTLGAGDSPKAVTEDGSLGQDKAEPVVVARPGPGRRGLQANSILRVVEEDAYMTAYSQRDLVAYRLFGGKAATTLYRTWVKALPVSQLLHGICQVLSILVLFGVVPKHMSWLIMVDYPLLFIWLTLLHAGLLSELIRHFEPWFLACQIFFMGFCLADMVSWDERFVVVIYLVGYSLSAIVLDCYTQRNGISVYLGIGAASLLTLVIGVQWDFVFDFNRITYTWSENVQWSNAGQFESFSVLLILFFARYSIMLLRNNEAFMIIKPRMENHRIVEYVRSRDFRVLREKLRRLRAFVQPAMVEEANIRDIPPTPQLQTKLAESSGPPSTGAVKSHVSGVSKASSKTAVSAARVEVELAAVPPAQPAQLASPATEPSSQPPLAAPSPEQQPLQSPAANPADPAKRPSASLAAEPAAPQATAGGAEDHTDAVVPADDARTAAAEEPGPSAANATHAGAEVEADAGAEAEVPDEPAAARTLSKPHGYVLNHVVKVISDKGFMSRFSSADTLAVRLFGLKGAERFFRIWLYVSHAHFISIVAAHLVILLVLCGAVPKWVVWLVLIQLPFSIGFIFSFNAGLMVQILRNFEAWFLILQVLLTCGCWATMIELDERMVAVVFFLIHSMEIVFLDSWPLEFKGRFVYVLGFSIAAGIVHICGVQFRFFIDYYKTSVTWIGVTWSNSAQFNSLVLLLVVFWCKYSFMLWKHPHGLLVLRPLAQDCLIQTFLMSEECNGLWQRLEAMAVESERLGMAREAATNDKPGASVLTRSSDHHSDHRSKEKEKEDEYLQKMTVILAAADTEFKQNHGMTVAQLNARTRATRAAMTATDSRQHSRQPSQHSVAGGPPQRPDPAGHQRTVSGGPHRAEPPAKPNRVKLRLVDLFRRGGASGDTYTDHLMKSDAQYYNSGPIEEEEPPRITAQDMIRLPSAAPDTRVPNLMIVVQPVEPAPAPLPEPVAVVVALADLNPQSQSQPPQLRVADSPAIIAATPDSPAVSAPSSSPPLAGHSQKPRMAEVVLPPTAVAAVDRAAATAAALLARPAHTASEPAVVESPSVIGGDLVTVVVGSPELQSVSESAPPT